MIKPDAPFCFHEPGLTKQEVYAIQMVANGAADAYHQKLAISAIVKKLCRAHDVHFIPGEADQTAFLQGRGFVGQRITRYINMSPAELDQEPENEKRHPGFLESPRIR